METEARSLVFQGAETWGVLLVQREDAAPVAR